MTNLQSFYGAGVVTLARATAVCAGGVTRSPNRPPEPRCLRNTVSQDSVSQDVRARRLSRPRGPLPREIVVPARM
jgi:hypothetical protein